MNIAYLRFYEELNDFLPLPKRKIRYPVLFRDNPSVKHLIEAEGIPHTEVDLILLNSNPVPFEEKVKNGDDVSAYPVFESFDISALNVLRPQPLRELRFILDVHLGKLTRYLRMMGFDSRFDMEFNDGTLTRIAASENRIILTRDRRLLMRKDVKRGYWIRSDKIGEQVSEIIRRFDLKHSLRFFSRCTICNGLLQPIDENEAKEQFGNHLFPSGTVFNRCKICHHIYWHGSHCDRFEKNISNLINVG